MILTLIHDSTKKKHLELASQNDWDTSALDALVKFVCKTRDSKITIRKSIGSPEKDVNKVHARYLLTITRRKPRKQRIMKIAIPA